MLGVYPGGLPILALLGLLVLVVGKQVAATAQSGRSRRLLRCLDVGIVPLSVASIAIALYELARVVGWLGS